MINHDYLIDCSDWFDEGGSCQVYPIKNHPNLIFKEFRNKKKAQESYRYNKKLEKFGLAPAIHSKICRLEFAPEDDLYQPEPSDWGYITELAKTYDPGTKIGVKDIQALVEEIYTKTGLEFWDCHWYNVGLVKRDLNKKLVCIDTGKESFEKHSNVWGLSNPGPICKECDQCSNECSC